MDNLPDIDAARFPLSKKVLEYSDLHEKLVIKSKLADFNESAWRELEQFVETDSFERVGTFKEVIDWEQYLQMLTEFGASGSWEGTFKGITEVGNAVFLELEERCGRPGGTMDIVNTCSVFRFNSQGQLNHLDIYMQSPSFALANVQTDTGFRPMVEAN